MDSLYGDALLAEPHTQNSSYARGFREASLSLNIASALGYSLLIYVSRNAMSSPPANDSSYYFLRGVVRVTDIFHAGMIAPVSASVVARQSTIDWGFGQAALVVSVLAGAALFFYFLRLANLAPSRTSGIIALFATPACYLVVSRLTWNWPSLSGSTAALQSFWLSRPLAVFTIEVFCLGILSIVFRKHRTPRWILSILLLLHYWFWVPILWSNVRLFALFVLVLLLPAAGVIWMLCVNSPPISSIETRKRGAHGMWTLATAVLALAALLVIWLPNMSHSLTRAQDMKSITIQLSRGPCRGTCPGYTITIHGNGTFEYLGKEYVKTIGPQSGTISEEQLARILQSLDRVRFSTLEDRAFLCCFDTPSVSVSVTVDGRTKRVVSDASCTGAKSGLQARFVQAADGIDNSVGSDRWTKCGGEPCRTRIP